MAHRYFETFRESLRNLEVLKTIGRCRFAGNAYLVGGALREVALGKLPNDYDFALQNSQDLTTLEDLFGAKSFLLGKKPIQTHRIVAGTVSIDLTLLQGGIEEDLLRRDFTINAMAYDVRQGAVIDPLHGFHDIERKIIRYPRVESIGEDPLRMVKAIRHLATLPRFSLDPALKAAVRASRAMIHQSASERIKYEFDLIMVSKGVHKGIRAMMNTGLLFEIFPELLPLREMDREKGFELETLGHTIGGFKYMNRARRFNMLSEKEVRQSGYALLFHDLGKAKTFSYDEEKGRVHFFYHERYSKEMATHIMERLRFSALESRAILALIEHHMRLFLISHKEATEKASRRAVYKLGELTPSLVLLTLLDMYGSSKGQENESTAQVRQRCREVLGAYEEWKKEPLPRLVNGRDLIGIGFNEGPELGRVLEEIRERQIAGEIGTREAALEYARESLERGIEGDKTVM